MWFSGQWAPDGSWPGQSLPNMGGAFLECREGGVAGAEQAGVRAGSKAQRGDQADDVGFLSHGRSLGFIPRTVGSW